MHNVGGGELRLHGMGPTQDYTLHTRNYCTTKSLFMIHP